MGVTVGTTRFGVCIVDAVKCAKHCRWVVWIPFANGGCMGVYVVRGIRCIVLMKSKGRILEDNLYNDVFQPLQTIGWSDNMHPVLIKIVSEYLRPNMDSFNNTDDWDIAHMGFLALRARHQNNDGQIWGEYWQFRNFLVYQKYNRGDAWNQQIEEYMRMIGV